MLHQVRTNLMQDFLGEHWAWGFLQCTRLKFKYEAQLFGQESWTSLFWTAVTHSASPTHESEIPAQLMSGMWNCLAGSDQFRILWDLQVEGLFFPFFFSPHCSHTSFHPHAGLNLCPPSTLLTQWTCCRWWHSSLVPRTGIFEPLVTGKIKKEAVWHKLVSQF